MRWRSQEQVQTAHLTEVCAHLETGVKMLVRGERILSVLTWGCLSESQGSAVKEVYGLVDASEGVHVFSQGESIVSCHLLSQR